MPKFTVSEGPKASEENLAKARAMLDADPEIRRLRELARIREERPLTEEETAEREKILAPIRELEKLGNMMA